MCVCVRGKERGARERWEGVRRGGREGGKIDPRLLKSCSGFSWSEVCACRRASPMQPPQEELFMEENIGIFEREKLHYTSEVDKTHDWVLFAFSLAFSPLVSE